MRRIAKVMIILTLCGWVKNGIDSLSAETLSTNSRGGVSQYRPHREQAPYRKAIMGKQDFQFLYEIIKGRSFEKDRLELLSVGVLDNYFSCRQCAKLLSIYSFDSDRLKALEIMANHIVDLDNADLVIDVFTFESNKNKAVKLLRPHRR